MGVFVCSVGRAVAAGVIDAKTGSMRRGTTGRVSWRLGGAGAEWSRSTECEARSTGEKEEKKRGKKRKKEKKKKGKKREKNRSEGVADDRRGGRSRRRCV